MEAHMTAGSEAVINQFQRRQSKGVNQFEFEAWSLSCAVLCRDCQIPQPTDNRAVAYGNEYVKS